MSLETSRKVLKISGILCFIGAAVSIVMGILATATGGVAGALPEAQTDAYQEGAGIVIALGIVTILSGVITLIEGIVAVRASKDNKYGKTAWLFAMISALISLGRAGSELKTNGMNASTVLSFLFTFLLAGLVYAAALNVKKAYDEEHR